MDPRMRTLLRKLPALLIGLVLACIPLWAQLDSKLQSGNTDFLDLYQQSTSTKVKPEILTIFDFSGSMARLMYHPLYVNSDTTDSGTYNYMSFTLTTQSSTYTITATSTANAKNYETCVVTVGGSGTYKLYTGGKPNPLTGVTASVSTFTAGATVTFTAAGTSAVTWTANGGSPTSGSGQTFSWTVPSSSSYVTATLKGNTVGALSSTILVKPDGTQVTSTDAASCSGSSSYYGESAGASDVRNWVRAASHVRFAYAVSTSVTRTIDVPIPWKIMSSASSGNPLSSLTVVDQEVVTKNGTSTTYGTGDAIEMDTVYAQNYGAYMFSSSTSDSSGTSSTTTSTLLRRVGYNADYVDWLFTGKYTVGTYKGYYIVFDAAKLGLAGGQDTLAEGKGYGADAANYSLYVPQYSLSGTYTSETYLAASINVVPALTRGQAVKRAAIKTWIAHQADVIWAFRFLDTSTTMENGTPSSVKTISNDTENYYYSSSVYGGDSGWRLFNASSESYMQLLASKLEYNGTPLTYAMARGLAQFTDPDSIFNSVETGDDAPSQCMNHFLILFTDGLDNNNTNTTNANGSTPYLTTTSGTTSFSAKAGNTTILASPSTINQTGTYWNLFTFAGVAAHMSNSSLGTAGTNYLAATSSSSGYASSSSTTTAYPSAFLPYAIKSRGSGTSKVTFSKDHRITTMTMGISLGGYYTDSSSPKRNLFLGAVVGDPTLTSWSDISTLVPFQWDATLNSGNGGRVSGSIYFFDGNTPDTLSTSLGYAIQSAISASNINTATVANLPYLGASLGSQIYIAKFQPPTNGGSIWGGDLLMFNTRLSSNTLQIVDTAGDATTTLTSSTAYWSALSALKTNRLWSARTLYTRIPGTSSTPEPGLSTFSDTGTAYTDSSTGLQNYVAQGTNKSTYTAGSTAQKNVIRFIMGGDLDGTLDSDGRPTTNRSNIMGDVINSSPAAIEYNYADVASSLPATLKAVGGDRFRLILVGTNQGWMHAFGEVTKASTITDSSGTSRTLRVGAVDELWAFMPTDFLSNLDQVTVSTNAHRFLVDGAPNIYHLDLPSSSGVSGDGKVEITTSPGPERVIALFGLGKGGRSYYALDVSNPFSPSVKWSIVPDEAAYFPASRILTRTGAPTISTVRTLLAHMGFSTCTPAIGRVLVTTTPGDSTTSIVRDVVFLGGGLSVPEVEANFTDSSGNAIPLGRQVLALDVYTGKVIAAVDMQDFSAVDSNGNPTMGPISKGLVPFEFIQNSGMAQRAYFLDAWGGLWSWGRQKTVSDTSSATYGYRTDTSDLALWTSDGAATSAAGMRLVAKDKFGNKISTGHYSEALYSTFPAPFRVSSFPGAAYTSGSPVPATVGVAMVSGDRNNPLDYDYTSTTLPTNHRLSVVFDRQDSALWSAATPIVLSSSSSAVLDAYPSFTSYSYGAQVLNPGSSTYYLAPSDASSTKFGYYRDFPTIDTSTELVSKGINTPTVVSGTLYYSYFTPTEADVCTGGSGYTYTWEICDVVNPIVADTRTSLSCYSGLKTTWVNIASDFAMLGTRGVIQSGTLSSTDSSGNTVLVLGTTTLTGQSKDQYPKPRVWRTVH